MLLTRMVIKIARQNPSIRKILIREIRKEAADSKGLDKLDSKSKKKVARQNSSVRKSLLREVRTQFGGRVAMGDYEKEWSVAQQEVSLADKMSELEADAWDRDVQIQDQLEKFLDELLEEALAHIPYPYVPKSRSLGGKYRFEAAVLKEALDVDADAYGVAERYLKKVNAENRLKAKRAELRYLKKKPPVSFSKVKRPR